MTALADTGRTAVEGAADVGIPLMLGLGLGLGRAVASADGVPVFPGKPAGFAPLTGLIVALAEAPAGPPHAVSNVAPAAAAAAAAARRQQ